MLLLIVFLLVLVFCKHCFSLLLGYRIIYRIISSATQSLIHSLTPSSSSSPTPSSFFFFSCSSSSRSRLLVISSICILRSFFHNLFVVSFRYSGKISPHFQIENTRGKTLDQESRPALNSRHFIIQCSQRSGLFMTSSIMTTSGYLM